MKNESKSDAFEDPRIEAYQKEIVMLRQVRDHVDHQHSVLLMQKNAMQAQRDALRYLVCRVLDTGLLRTDETRELFEELDRLTKGEQ